MVVLDNLGEGVLKPDIYDPTINPVYADMLRHYGVVAMPFGVTTEVFLVFDRQLRIPAKANSIPE